VLLNEYQHSVSSVKMAGTYSCPLIHLEARLRRISLGLTYLTIEASGFPLHLENLKCDVGACVPIAAFSYKRFLLQILLLLH